MTSVLDASALLALALGEPGAAMVADHARGSIISTVNVSEFLQRMTNLGAPEKEALVQLLRFEVEIAPFTFEHAQQTAALRPMTKRFGLSLGDRACLSLAIKRKLPVLTADRRMAEADVGLDIRMIR